MGKSILVLLILIITLVAAPFFGSFGEAIDKPVVFAASILSEDLNNQLNNAQYQLNQSFAVPQKTAMMSGSLMFTYESDLVLLERLILDPPSLGTLEEMPGPWDDLGFTIENDVEMHKYNQYDDLVIEPIPLGPPIILEPFGYTYVSDSDIHSYN